MALWKNRDMISIFNTSNDGGKKVVFRPHLTKTVKRISISVETNTII